MRQRAARRRWETSDYVRAGLPAVASFVATGVLAPLYSSEPFDLWGVLWQGVILWPIGALVVWVPVAMLVEYLRDPRLFRLGKALIVLFAVWSMGAVARSDDAQKGLYWLIAPMYGTPAIIALIVFQWARGQWRRRRSHDPELP